VRLLFWFIKSALRLVIIIALAIGGVFVILATLAGGGEK